MSKNSQSLDYVLNIVYVEGNVKNFFQKNLARVERLELPTLGFGDRHAPVNITPA